MTFQSFAQKQSEVNFRQLISEQHRGKALHFPEEYSQPEMLAEIKKRIASTRNDFNSMKKESITLSPYLEIGAEYGIRSLVLENEKNARGIALDIAQAPLSTNSWIARHFNYKRLPIRICADAHTLPLADNSFAFVFCYQTLHHFPDPQPIIKEAMRVVAPGGYFFFSEEPITQKFKINLFRRPTKQQGLNKFLKKLLLLPFISEIGKTETDHGIHEGTFSLSEWQQILEPYKVKKCTITTAFTNQSITINNPSQKWHLPLSLKTGLYLFGGGISALSQKPVTNLRGLSARHKKPQKPKLLLQPRCPDCKGKIDIKQLRCQNCHRRFRKKDQVLMLLPKNLEKKLYE